MKQMRRNNRKNLGKMLLAGMLVLGFLLSGCSSERDEEAYVLERCLSSVSFDPQKNQNAFDTECDEIVSAFIALKAPSRKAVLKTFGKRLRALPLDERSYPTRVRALSLYGSFIIQLTERLGNVPELASSAWLIRLEAIGRINDEIAICEHEPQGGSPGGTSTMFGPLMTRRQYKRHLKSLRFELIRDGFEFGRFTGYFHSCSLAEQQKWLLRLEEVARRKVVIWSPDTPFMKMPQDEPEENEKGDGDELQADIEHLGGGRLLKLHKVKELKKF